MYEKIVEIIAFLMSELNSNHSISETTFKDLSNQGYTDTEISAAFGWLADRSQIQEQLIESIDAQKHSFRILHEFEQMYISPEVYGYFLQLFQLDVLTHDQIETVIERCLMSGMQPVDMNTAKFSVGSILFNAGQYEVPSQRIFLNGTDTIH